MWHTPREFSCWFHWWTMSRTNMAGFKPMLIRWLGWGWTSICSILISGQKCLQALCASNPESEENLQRHSIQGQPCYFGLGALQQTHTSDGHELCQGLILGRIVYNWLAEMSAYIKPISIIWIQIISSQQVRRGTKQAGILVLALWVHYPPPLGWIMGPKVLISTEMQCDSGTAPFLLLY